MNECVEQAAVFPKEEEGKSAILFRVCKNPKYNVTKESHEKRKSALSFGNKTTTKEYNALVYKRDVYHHHHRKKKKKRASFDNTLSRRRSMVAFSLRVPSSSSFTSSLFSSQSSFFVRRQRRKMRLDNVVGIRSRKRKVTSSAKEEEDKEEEDEQTFIAKTELNLGRSAMLGFAATTYLDVSTNGLGPIEQLIGEEKSLVTHVVNPLNLARDVLEVTGLYVESIILVWVFLSGVFLLAVTSGLRKPSTSTMSGMSRPNGENRVDAMAGIVKSAWREQVRENKKYENFNGRLAMLGITASFIGDYFLAEGPMEQVAQELGVPVIDQEIFALVFLSAASFLLVSTLVRVGRRALTESN
jgi:photosystem II protein